MGGFQTVSAKGSKVFYGWVIVAASLAMLVMLAGIVYSFGIFFKSLVAEFGWSRTATSGVVTTYFISHATFAIPAGWLSDRYGPRKVILVCNLLAVFGLILLSRVSSLWQMYLFYGVMVGAGLSGTFTILTSTTARWFVRRRGLALGIVASGVGLGTMLVAPLAEQLIAWFDWRGAYLTLGLVAAAVMVPIAFLLYKDPSVLGLLPYGQSASAERAVVKTIATPDRVHKNEEGFSVKEILRSMPFWIILIVLLLFFVTQQMTMAHLYNHATDIGIPGVIAATFIGVIGGSSIIGRLGTGVIYDRAGPRAVMVICSLVAMASFIFLIFASTSWMFYLFSVVFGLAYGGEVALAPAVCGHFFGLKLLGFAVGATMAGMSIGGAIGPLFAGMIFDSTGSYAIAFLVAVGLCLVCFVLTLFLRPSQSALQSGQP